MYYSFDFAANITLLCMEEIRNRGLQERKIFRKSLPNSGLFIKVFTKQTCQREDLKHVDIHSVATLMQDALWSSHERIISKKAWRTINYETCTLSKLSSVISSKSENFLLEILDFLVEVMYYKGVNLMDAYKLGDALGKVVLGPSDCGPIMAEKAGHFLTRMIIEHAKIQHQRQYKKAVRRIDSGFDSSGSFSCHSFYNEYHPICKAQGTQARAKFYNRDIKKTQWVKFDWCDNAVGVRAMLDNEYENTPDVPEKPWLSIFTAADLLLKLDVAAPPILFRILREAIKPLPIVSKDPFATSYLFQSKAYWTERQLHNAFHEFHPQNYTVLHFPDVDDRLNPLKKLNHSLSHLKLNIKKYRSRHDLLNDSDDESSQDHYDDYHQVSKGNDSMMSVMKKMMKFGQVARDMRSKSTVF